MQKAVVAGDKTKAAELFKTAQAVIDSVADKGINIDLLYVATHNRVVFGSPDLPGLKAALGQG